MDVNLAFAILVLVAAIVAMYFWVENADQDVEDIYDERQEVSVPRSGEAEVIDEDAEVVDAMDATESTEPASKDMIVE